MSNAVAHTENTIEEQLQHCYSQIEKYRGSIQNLVNELEAVEEQLSKLTKERQQYEVLSKVSESLEQLESIGSSMLFWNGLVTTDQVPGQLSHLRDLVAFFERRVKKVSDKHDELSHQIHDNEVAIAHVEDEIDHLREQKEESQYEYAIVREIKPIPYRVMAMPWTTQGQDEKKFRKILALVLLLSFLLGLLVEWYVVPIPNRAEVVQIPERLAKLVKKKLPEPKKEKPKPQEKEKKPTDEKKPTEKERTQAREKVKSKGVLAFKNNFADLLDDASLDKLGAQANLSNAGSTAKRTQRSIITSSATSTSGGISTSSLSRNVAGTGDKIDAVAFSRVDSEIGTAIAEDRPLSDGPGPSRTDEEIQIVFDRYKSALYRIYNQELRKNPTLQGKVVLRITIESDGSVSKCKVESTDLVKADWLDKIVDRVKRINFGAKEGVAPLTILYPIDFLPAS